MERRQVQVPRVSGGRRKSRTSRGYGAVMLCAVTALLLGSSWLAVTWASGEAPALNAGAAIALDLKTGSVLYEKNSGQRMYPASLTKLMTAILLAEDMRPDDVLIYSEGAQAQEPVKLDLPVGSTMTAADAMDALLVSSANDVAYMIAENLAGSAEEFARLMNTKARELGLRSTHFVTPSGLHDHDHYSTATDLAALFKEALRYTWIREALGAARATLESVPTSVTNTNLLLGSKGCVAGKTGYTSMAGKCLAALFQRRGRQIIAVVLHSDTDETLVADMEAIADWSIRSVR